MIRQNKRQNGFTVVELLVVVVIIGILAVIAVATFKGLQQRANESASATAVETANKKLDVYKIANRFYPGSLTEAEVQDYADTSYQYTRDSDQLGYCLTATTNNVSMFGSDIVPQAARGGCAGHAVDGVPPITNYALNPSVESSPLLNNGWSFVSAAGYTGATSTAQKYHGTRSASVAVATITKSDSYLLATVSVPSAGTYYVSAYVYLTSNAAGFAGGTCAGGNNDAKWYNGTAWVNVCYNRSTLNTWQKVGTTLTAAGATSFQLRFYPPVANPATLYVDGLMVSNGNSTYADGNTSGWLWNGTANNSTSSGLPQ